MSNMHKKSLKGFSLGEVILAVAVLTVGLLPILGAMSGALNTSLGSEDVIVATGLAQEGAELVVNVKDNSVLSANDAFVAFPTSGGSAHSSSDTCRISYDSAVLTNPSSANTLECSSSGSNWYDLTLSGSFYKHTGAQGKFKRKIYLVYDNPNYLVGSAVYWGAYVPGNANNRNQFDTVRSGCTTANECIFVSVETTPWK